MNILHLTTTDPAGAAYALASAVNHHTPHRARVVATHRIETYDFPTDIHWICDAGDEVGALLEQADVLHLHKVDDEFRIEFNMPKAGIKRVFTVKDVLKSFPGKKVVYHIHGHPYERQNVQENAENYKRLGGKVLASTPDLEEMYRPFYDQVSYFPNCVPVNDALYLPRATDKPIVYGDGVERYLVGQCPTHAILKNIHVIEAAVREAAKLVPVQLSYLKMWNMSRDSALRQLRTAHVVFDHIEGYYGMASLEGMSLGKPVIAGLSDYTKEAIRKFFDLKSYAELPWCVAKNKEEIVGWLETLFKEPGVREMQGRMSRKFMEEVWSDRIIGQRLAALYASL